jgi:hypothetical protein
MYREDTISCLDDARGFLSHKITYPDHDDIIKGYLKNNRLKKLVF